MWKRLLGDLLSPPCCAACDARTPSANVFCPACAATIVRDEGLETPLALAAFGGAMAVAIRRFKYESRPDLAGPLSDLLRGLARRAELEGDAVVPVPLHPRRLAERGYNQAALLARPLAREIGARFEPRGLIRKMDTPRQAELIRERRFDNVAEAFAVRDPERLRGERLILVDDVSTTGATLGACRRLLEEAGAASVRMVVLARTLSG